MTRRHLCAESGNGERSLAFASRAGNSNAVSVMQISVIQSAMKLSVVLGRGYVAASTVTDKHQCTHRRPFGSVAKKTLSDVAAT